MKILSFCKKIIKKGLSIITKRWKKYLTEKAINRYLLCDYKRAANFLKIHTSYALCQLSAKEKHEIDEFWAQYGVKFPDYTWFQMYYSVTGIHSPKFLVNIFVFSVLYNYYNNQEDVLGWDDKNIYEKLVHNVKFPESLAHKINGRYYDDEYKPYDNTEDGLKRLSERIYSKLNGETDLIVKMSKGSFAGKGVMLIKDIHSANDVMAILQENGARNYIMQRKIEQHPFFSQFCSTSVNIIRLITWHDGNEVKIFSATIRFGIEGSVTDVTYVNGKEIVNVVGVNEDGIINGKFMSFDGIAENHPIIIDKQVPSWKKLRNAVVEAHKEMFHFDLIGWDFTIDKGGNPICIEYNIKRPGTILYQYTNGPLAGKYTEEFLAFLKDRSDLIPPLLRLKPKK